MNSRPLHDSVPRVHGFDGVRMTPSERELAVTMLRRGEVFAETLLSLLAHARAVMAGARIPSLRRKLGVAVAHEAQR